MDDSHRSSREISGDFFTQVRLPDTRSTTAGAERREIVACIGSTANELDAALFERLSGANRFVV